MQHVTHFSKQYNNSQHLWTNNKRHSRGADTLSMLTMETLETRAECYLCDRSHALPDIARPSATRRFSSFWFLFPQCDRFVLCAWIFIGVRKLSMSAGWKMVCDSSTCAWLYVVRLFSPTGNSKTKRDSGDLLPTKITAECIFPLSPYGQLITKPFAPYQQQQNIDRPGLVETNSPKSRKREGLRSSRAGMNAVRQWKHAL